MAYQTLQQAAHQIDRKKIFVISTAILTVVTAFWVRKAVKKSKEFDKKGAKKIPMPTGDYFYLGHAPLFENGIVSRVNEWHRQLGPLFRIKMGVQNWVFIGDPRIAHDIFVTRGVVSSGRPYLEYGRNTFSEGHRGIVFMDNTKSWKKNRAIVTNSLSSQFVDSLHSLINRETELSVSLLVNDYLKSSDEAICPIDYTRLSSMNLVLCTFFGIPSASSIEDPLFKDMDYVIQKHVEFAGIIGDKTSYYPILSSLNFISQRERKAKSFVYSELRPFYHKLIKRSRENKQPSLAKTLDSEKESLGLDNNDIIVILLDAIVGAVDTISYAMSFSLATLCHHPEWQRKIAREIDDFVKKNNRMPMYTERQHLPITLAVMKEMFRYRSSSSLGLAHRATEDIVYQDYIIPKDTILISNNVTTNHSSSFFKEPEKFNPERFLGDIRSLHSSSNGNINNREVFTFGWGRRICPGIYLSETEIFCWMCHLFYRCTVEPIVSSTGEKVYPDIDSLIEYGGIIAPVPFEVRLVTRSN
ncbi:cytochrome P450 [Sporodiniella umbellata]|nr:cytochrome P450 [Sporodiniella umbellata]